MRRRSRTIATTCHAVRKRLPFGPTNSATGPPPLEGPGSARCSRSTRPRCGRRNCNVDLNNLRWDRPDLDCEPQQARVIPRNLQVDETGVVVMEEDGAVTKVCGHGVVALDGVNVVKPSKYSVGKGIRV